MSKTLTLVGLPGSGKTYWGKKLARELSVHFYDLDTIIEQATQESIASIFAKEGEDVFRALESVFLKEILVNNRSNLILSCGGGTPAFADNMQLINKYSQSIFLNLKTSNIIKNLQQEQQSHRPLLKKLSLQEVESFINHLRNQRMSFYEQSEITLDEATLNLEHLKAIFYAEE